MRWPCLAAQRPEQATEAGMRPLQRQLVDGNHCHPATVLQPQKPLVQIGAKGMSEGIQSHQRGLLQRQPSSGLVEDRMLTANGEIAWIGLL